MATATARICAHEGCDTILSRFNNYDRCSLHDKPAPAEPALAQPKYHATLCANERCFNAVGHRASGYCSDKCEREATMTATATANGSGTRQYAPRTCDGCGEDYTPTSPRQRYCKPDCRPAGPPAPTRPTPRSRGGASEPSTPTPPAATPAPAAPDPRRRYLDLLFSHAERAEELDEELLERIERVLDQVTA